MNDFFKNQNGSADLTNILKAFYEYFKIYKQAKHTVVSKWKVSDCENVIKWSHMIEELHPKFINKPYYEKLLNTLKQLSKYWSINDNEVEELIKNPSYIMKNVK